MKIPTKNQTLAIATGIFSAAAALGSTLLSPEQRQAILRIIVLIWGG